jgi:hypothetical protein
MARRRATMLKSGEEGKEVLQMQEDMRVLQFYQVFQVPTVQERQGVSIFQ